MRTGTLKLVTFGAAGLMAGVLALGSAAGADEIKAQNGEGRKQRLLNGDYGPRIDQHIKRIEDAIANHPKMSAEAKAALEKIIADLKDKKADLDKLAGDVRAGDKPAVKADRAELKQDRLQLAKDRLPLIDACIAHLEGRLAKHPNAPAEVKAAVEKLVADLKDRKADLEKLISDLGAGNRDAVKADRTELKSDHQQIVKDRQALKGLIKNDRAQWRNKAGK